ncbi:hypothetical protein DOTSEDRAFT_75972 [Dothistroma septosporum NZE10]|uniref:Uncharacterized protein n=1 Tax=Dothistroma septosporum (strain NZE10 / CBS 128990) TaxID=675120 RepID=M2XGB7_DOTSN|nr:hypothetical protein DOTSEDRAFT_75972 [Dothistroma septosporum NZE10]
MLSVPPSIQVGGVGMIHLRQTSQGSSTRSSYAGRWWCVPTVRCPEIGQEDSPSKSPKTAAYGS